MKNTSHILRRTAPEDHAQIRSLATSAWKVAYADILSEEQMTYMLDMMYSDQSLEEQARNGHVFFFAYLTGKSEPAGFISLHPASTGYYILEKLYVSPQRQGAGTGRFLVEQAEIYIRNQNPGEQILFELHVNRSNEAVGFYERMGFHIDRTEDEDIGNGFYKNDYIMQKTIYC
jgi:ribosomal protein S18 acetylase RimI-like enzyme